MAELKPESESSVFPSYLWSTPDHCHVAKSISIHKEYFDTERKTGKKKELILGFAINEEGQNQVIPRTNGLKILGTEQVNESSRRKYNRREGTEGKKAREGNYNSDE